MKSSWNLVADALVVDQKLHKYWSARMEDPLADVQTLRLTDGNGVIELGKKPKSVDDIQGQYTGLIKVWADHVRKFSDVWHAMDRNAVYDGKVFDNMYMTSFLQYLIDRGWDVRAAFIENGWAEVDHQDYLTVASAFSNLSV